MSDNTIEKDMPQDASAEQNVAEENVSEEKVSEETATPVEVEEGVSEEPLPEENAAPAEEHKEECGIFSKTMLPYHERYYLLYDGEKRSSAMDLSGTNAFLKEIGYDGGELRKARRGKNYAQIFGELNKGDTSQLYCSYCGCEISGVEYYRLPDGRLRCTSCGGSVVKSKTEVEDIYKRVLSNLDTFFGALINVPVSIEVLEERGLKKKIGLPLGDRDTQSMLILGVAVNKKEKYRILLENGAPRISLIATFAHELTHIWQYINWDNKKDFKKCPQSKRLLIYEGMAKWAEIQYLYFIGETNVARREEMITRRRQDEYGLGFCLYESYYPLSRETMKCEKTPFTPERYPFDE